jgi:hypothetical protein
MTELDSVGKTSHQSVLVLMYYFDCCISRGNIIYSGNSPIEVVTELAQQSRANTARDPIYVQPHKPFKTMLLARFVWMGIDGPIDSSSAGIILNFAQLQ